MNKLFGSDSVYISNSKIPGVEDERGVFAKRDIKKDEIIEKCPTVQVSEHDTANLKESILNTYFFYFGKHNKRLLVALGFGSIYNHSHKPNAEYKIKSSENIMEFIALSNIEKNDEITIRYNSLNPNNKIPLWFEVTS